MYFVFTDGSKNQSSKQSMYTLVGQSNATLVCLETVNICFGDFIHSEDLFVNQNNKFKF